MAVRRTGRLLPLGAPDVSATVAPALTGWQAHEHPFAFEPEMEYADAAWRWLSGTPVIPALFAAIEGPRILRAAGIDADAGEERAADVAPDRAGRRARVSGDGAARPARRGGTVAFDVPHAREVAQALLASDVIVDYRPGAGIRVAPHFYTSDDELERVVAMIDDILAQRRVEAVH